MSNDALRNHKVYLMIMSRIAKLNAEAQAKGRTAPYSASLVQPSFLQLEVPLANGSNAFKFAVNQTDTLPPQRNSETRLNNNDAFVVHTSALFFKNEAPANAGQGHLASYINQTEFPAQANYFNPTDLDAAGFNSQLFVKVGDVVFVNNLDLRPSRNVRTTQQTSGSNYSEQLGNDGMFAQEPIITLDGSKKNQVVMNINTWQGQLIQYSGNNATQVYAVLKFWGFLVTNGSGLGVVNYQ